MSVGPRIQPIEGLGALAKEILRYAGIVVVHFDLDGMAEMGMCVAITTAAEYQHRRPTSKRLGHSVLESRRDYCR